MANKFNLALVLIGLVVVVSSMIAVAEESCECVKLACDPCSQQQGITFFTHKCGENNARLKSCARPTCVALTTPTEQCPVLPKASEDKREPVIVKNTVDQADPNADIKLVGGIKVLSGSVTVVHADGKKIKVDGEMRVRESDTIQSAAESTALVQFDGGNKLHVHPDTVVQVKEYTDPQDSAGRKALLQLIKGKIRSQVEQKYNGKTSYYRVTTPAAVAGVRGTDFVMEHHEGAQIETRVETLTGKVTLASLDEKQIRELLRGEGAVFTADLPDTSFQGKDVSEFIQRGKLSAVYKIPGERLAELDADSRVTGPKRKKVKAAPVASEKEICANPKGFFNQCAWECRGASPKAKSCGEGGGTCVRTRCNGNGTWADETTLPASRTGECPAKGAAVKACDY